jgi:hypothetical protein
MKISFSMVIAACCRLDGRGGGRQQVNTSLKWKRKEMSTEWFKNSVEYHIIVYTPKNFSVSHREAENRGRPLTYGLISSCYISIKTDIYA